MIYMTGTDGLHIVILDTQNLEELKKGRPATSPGGKVLIAWTPDIAWLAAELSKTGGDGPDVGRLIDESRNRPEKAVDYHGPEGTKLVKVTFPPEDG